MGKYTALGRECEQLYCEGNTLETISKITGVSLRTLSLWKNANNWEYKRFQYRKQPEAIHSKISTVFSGFLDQLLESGIKSNKEPDSVSKLASALNKMGGIEDIPGMAYTIMKKFSDYIEKNCPDEELKDKFYNFIHGFLQNVKEMVYGND